MQEFSLKRSKDHNNDKDGYSYVRDNVQNSGHNDCRSIHYPLLSVRSGDMLLPICSYEDEYQEVDYFLHIATFKKVEKRCAKLTNMMRKMLFLDADMTS